MSLFFGRRSESRDMSYGQVWSTGGNVANFNASSFDAATSVVPVYAAWRLIADQVASLPLRAYRQRPDGSREQLPAQPSLCTKPSAYGSVFDWKQRAVISMLSRGNAVGYITARDGVGRAAMIEWLNPDDVSVDDNDPGRPSWAWRGRMLDPVDLVHIPAMVQPGRVWGVSPMRAFQTTFETGKRAQDFGRDWFKNGAVPGGILKNSNQTISPEVAQAARERFKAATRGRELFVTGSDWDYSTLSVPADEARFIETLKLTATQVASIYGIPAEMIGGETGSSLTYATVEQNAINFVTYALRPWLVRIEEALSALLPQPQYVRFNVDALVRADLKTRMEAHAIALNIGLETNDEGRAIEDRPPLTPDQKAEWVDTYRSTSSTNMPATPGGAP